MFKTTQRALRAIAVAAGHGRVAGDSGASPDSIDSLWAKEIVDMREAKGDWDFAAEIDEHDAKNIYEMALKIANGIKVGPIGIIAPCPRCNGGRRKGPCRLCDIDIPVIVSPFMVNDLGVVVAVSELHAREWVARVAFPNLWNEERHYGAGYHVEAL